MGGFQALYGLGLPGRLVLDALRLVQDYVTPGYGIKLFFIPLGKGVGGDNHICLFRRLLEVLAGEAAQAVMHEHFQPGGKALDLSLPVAGNRHRTDEKSGAGALHSLSLMQKKCNQLYRFSQTHIIRQTGSQAEPVQVHEPGYAP